VRRCRLEDLVTVTGYLADHELTECIAASDVTLNLRWPTAREISGTWLRCLAAGKPSVIIDLAHLSHVPALDPRTWQPHPAGTDAAPICVALDIADEEHSLRLAVRRLATDEALRNTLGRAAREYWTANHSVDLMISDYRKLIAIARGEQPPRPALPTHLRDDHGHIVRNVTAMFGLSSPLG
jgi:hypothetical protein